MAAEWYYTQNNQQQGPVTLEALQAMAANGQIQRSDLIWRQGMANWQAAGDVPGVYGGGGPTGAPGQPAWGGPPMGSGGAYGGAGYPPGGTPGVYAGGYPGQQLGYGAQSFAKEAREAMIYSIVGLFCCGIILGPVGLVKGLNAQKSMAATGNFEGKGMATAAVIIGIIATVIHVLGLIGNVAMRSGNFGR